MSSGCSAQSGEACDDRRRCHFRCVVRRSPGFRLRYPRARPRRAVDVLRANRRCDRRSDRRGAGMKCLAGHRFADLFPMIEGQARDELRDDIRDNGIREKIVLLDGQILDGRNRYDALLELCDGGEVLGEGWGHRAGEALDAELLTPPAPWFVTFNPSVDGDPLKWVLSKNLRRRHLDESQRAIVAARLANLGVGRPKADSRDDDKAKPFDPAPEHIPPIGGISARAAAAMVNVSERSVERARAVINDGVEELQHAVEQGQLAVSAAEKIARLPDDEQREAVAKLPSGSRSIMASRQEPDDGLDYFPTPPWATRALVEVVLKRSGHAASLHAQTAWEPACGEGHMAEVLCDYFKEVTASDIHPHGYGHTANFLGDIVPGFDDWIITNPPFGANAEAFVLRALQFAQVGVAMFLRLQWLETVGRFERVFQPYPPAIIAQFAERVPLHKGRWEPEGDTATAYLWIVWLKNSARKTTEFVWIPPGQREALSRPDDAERFTTHPVTKAFRPNGPKAVDAPAQKSVPAAEDSDAKFDEAIDRALQRAPRGYPESGAAFDPSPIACACCNHFVVARPDPLDIPSFLKRRRNDVALATAKACA
ncbi:hypothetical protein [Rhodopseudomonas telluris]|uniref:Methyltransferase n=1 Tax=Rhodopseudomonas telluris TaxID=644215 RepID=A0ABV6EZL1_9BRAD